MRRLPPLGPIEAFVQVGRLGSVKSAADSLALSSPALTRRVQALEQFVGTPLFDRSHNAVMLNRRGEEFLSALAPHLDGLAAAVERASSLHNGRRLRLAVPSLFASQRLMPALPSLAEQHPDLHIELDTGGDRLGRLGEGVDAAIVIATAVDPRLYSRRIERGRIIAIGSRSLVDGANPIGDPDDLGRYPVLLHRDMPETFTAWRDGIGRPGLEAKSVTFFDAGQLILDAAAEGLGIAFMLESHLASSTDDRLARIFAEAVDSPYGYWFACTHPMLARPAVRALHDWLLAHFCPNAIP